MTNSGTAIATAAATTTDHPAQRWLATIVGLPSPAILSLLENRWRQNRTGNPLWHLNTLRRSQAVDRRTGARRTP